MNAGLHGTGRAISAVTISSPSLRPLIPDWRCSLFGLKANGSQKHARSIITQCRRGTELRHRTFCLSCLPSETRHVQKSFVGTRFGSRRSFHFTSPSSISTGAKLPLRSQSGGFRLNKELSSSRVLDNRAAIVTKSEEGVGSPSSSSIFVASALLTDDLPGGTRLELRLAKSWTSADQIYPDNFSSDNTSQPAITITIPPIKSQARIDTAKEQAEKDKQTNRNLERRMRMQAGNVSWISLLNNLEISTPAVDLNQCTVTISGSSCDLEEFYYTILGDATFNVILDYPSTYEGHGSTLLAGSEKAVSEIEEFISVSEAFQGLTVRYQSQGPATPESVPPPAVQGSPVRTAPRPLEFVLPPKSWTKRSFAEHVRAVTQSRPAYVLHQGIAHDRVVARVLHSLFSRISNLRQVLSWSAIHQAISYLVKHKHGDSAKQLLRQMDRNGYPPSAETFNIFLRSCAREQNLVAFRRHLNVMLEDGILPNEGTWIALMSGAPTIDDQQAIARSMFRRGFSVRAAFARDNAPQIIPYSFGPFLDTGGSVADWSETMNTLYGPTWVTAEAVDHMVDILASRGQFVDAVKLVNSLRMQYAISPLKVVLRTLLKHCKRQQNADFAIWCVVYASGRWQVNPKDPVVLETLFQIAYDSRMFNFLRVIWKYSCAWGQVSFIQRRLLYKSLYARLQPLESTVLKQWASEAGAVACGIDPLADNGETVETILDRERRLFGSEAHFNFKRKLVEALYADQHWTQEQVKKTRPLTWKIKYAVQVPFEPRQFPLQEPAPRRRSSAKKLQPSKLASGATHRFVRQRSGGLKPVSQHRGAFRPVSLTDRAIAGDRIAEREMARVRGGEEQEER